LGAPIGITARIPTLIRDSEYSKVSTVDDYFLYFIRLFAIITIGLTVIFIFFSSSIVEFLVGDSKEVNFFIIILASAPFMVAYSISDAFLRCYGKLSQIVLIAIVSSVSSLLLLYPLIEYLGMTGVSFYFFLSGVFPFVAFLIINRSYVKKILNKKIEHLLDLKSQILKMGSVSLLSSFLFIGSFIILRKFVIDNLGLVDNGIFQSVVALSNSIFMIIYSYLSTYLLPKLSKYIKNKEINEELDNSFRFILFMIVPSIILAFSYRYLIIRAIFSVEFLKASDIIIYQFLGDFFRCLSGLFCLWLIPRMRIRTIMTFDIIMNLSLVLLPYIYMLLFNKIFLGIVPISYMVAMILHFIMYLSITIKDLHYRISAHTLRTIIISALCISASFLSGWGGYLFQYLAAPLLILFFGLIAISKVERFKLIQLGKSYVSFFTKSDKL